MNGIINIIAIIISIARSVSRGITRNTQNEYKTKSKRPEIKRKLLFIYVKKTD